MIKYRSIIDWKVWKDVVPEKEGTYLTLWSDMTIEPFYLEEEDFEQDRVMIRDTYILMWAEANPYLWEMKGEGGKWVPVTFEED